jgi:hypothetical protein
MLRLNKLNDINIKPVIDNSKRDPKKIVGYDYFNEPYSNVCLVARKQSGKTTTIFRALEKCVMKGTNVILIASSVNNDATFKKMKKMLKEKKCNVTSYTDFILDDGSNVIEEFLHLMSKDAVDEDGNKKDDDISEIPRSFADFGQYNHLIKNEDGKKKKKPTKENPNKKICPETIIVIDDMSTACRHPSISRLLTKNRHYKLKVFISCHSVVNLDPMGLRMIDVFMLYPNLSEERIQEVSEKVGISFKSDTKKHKKLYDIYCDATREPYNFLYIDRNNCTYRKIFNQLYELRE